MRCCLLDVIFSRKRHVGFKNATREAELVPRTHQASLVVEAMSTFLGHRDF